MAEVSNLNDLDWNKLPGCPWLPCPICHGVEGCDHTYLERARAANPGLIIITIVRE